MNNSFVQRHAQNIIGILSGFDRLVLRGYLRRIAYATGLLGFLAYRRIRLTDFGAFAERVTAQVRTAVQGATAAEGRPVVHLESSKVDKEAKAREIARRDGIRQGTICVLSTLEPCATFEVYRNRDAKRLELKPRIRKCLHYYRYAIDPVFGFMYGRLQTWLPFPVQVWINGRERLARQMDACGLAYRREGNCFPWIADFDRAQVLMNEQLRTNWRGEMQRIVEQVNPVHADIFGDFSVDYYWSVSQSEWATDLVLRDAETLRTLSPKLMDRAMREFSSGDIMRFLGGKPHGNFRGEIVSEFKNRAEGMRVKHRVGGNSVKMYTKAENGLRVETTIGDVRGIKVFRTKEGDASGKRDWLSLRKSTADLYRRANVSQASNGRYLEALGAADVEETLGELLAPVTKARRWKGRRVRGLRPWAEEDRKLLAAVFQGEFRLTGVRNRDLQRLLYASEAASPEERRRRSARVGRLIRLLRAHGILRKVARSHRYHLTPAGGRRIAAVLAAYGATASKLEGVA